MATNKNAAIRYKILDKAFRNHGKRYYIEDLIQECNIILKEIDPDSSGISRRQVLMDISFMESSEGWSIDLDHNKIGKKVFYRYKDKNYSVYNMPLNDLEINQLHLVLSILSQFKGMPQFDFIPGLISRLNNGIDNPSPTTIIEFDSNDDLRGIGFLGELYSAIFYQQALQIAYRPYANEKPYLLDFHPYYLRQYNNRWFVFGYNPYDKRPDWNLALDRIESISILNNEYVLNTQIDWFDYFYDIIGVTRPVTEVEEIVLHFYGKTGKYMETKPLHGSQRSNWINKDTLEVKLSLRINYELERLIFSYADSVRVISPLSLIKIFNKKLEAALKLNNVL